MTEKQDRARTEASKVAKWKKASEDERQQAFLESLEGKGKPDEAIKRVRNREASKRKRRKKLDLKLPRDDEGQVSTLYAANPEGLGSQTEDYPYSRDELIKRATIATCERELKKSTGIAWKDLPPWLPLWLKLAVDDRKRALENEARNALLKIQEGLRAARVIAKELGDKTILGGVRASFLARVVEATGGDLFDLLLDVNLSDPDLDNNPSVLNKRQRLAYFWPRVKHHLQTGALEFAFVAGDLYAAITDQAPFGWGLDAESAEVTDRELALVSILLGDWPAKGDVGKSTDFKEVIDSVVRGFSGVSGAAAKANTVRGRGERYRRNRQGENKV